ncbi:MAG: carboxypeptidase regulatory-like domain-containing protein [Pyrinomonadaceae bacterium]|nr:carboxypeptidase regulatory-like domain-containing protein [Pyrinomonadaceae bacterium]
MVIARAISFEKVSDQSELPIIGTRVLTTTMEVEKVFKGKLRVGDKMVFGQGNGIRCTHVFYEDDVGKEYLFYLHWPPKDENLWYEFGLGRSHRLEYAADDLLYLNKMDKMRGRTRISGVLDVDGDGLSSEGQTIRIIGKNKTHMAKTDKNGVYELYDVPPGRYVLAPELKAGWKVEEFRLTRPFTRSELMNGTNASNRVAFTLRSRRHFGVDMRLELSNHVSGIIYDSSSKPMRRVCVSLVPIDDDRFLACNSLTDDQGRFQIDSVEAGTYLIILNYENKRTAEMPFPKLYYPGVTDRDQAKVITVKHGEVVNDLKVVIRK